MKAIRIHKFGGAEVMRYEDALEPKAGRGQVVIQVEAAGLNYSDILTREGPNEEVRFPWVMGKEAAGRVVSVGEGAEEFREGDMVAVTWGTLGGYAERVAAPWERVVKLPSGIDARLGAAIMLQGLTAHYLADTTYPLKKGDRCLIHAGAGGMGLILIQIAKMRGAYVFTTVSTEEKAGVVSEAGADHVIIYTRENFEKEIKKATGGEGVHVVYDGVGKTTFEGSLNSLGVRGLLVLHSRTGGAVPPISPWILVKGSKFLTWPSLWDHIADRETLLRRTGELFEWVRKGTLKIRIGHEYSLSEAAEAHRAMEGRRTMGKVLLIP